MSAGSHSNEQIHLTLRGKLAVGSQFRCQYPTVNDIDFNPDPEACPSQHTTCMVACGSSEGTSIHKLVPGSKEQCRWMASGSDRFYKMYVSPLDEGETTVVKFNPANGRILLTGSRSGLLKLLVFDNNVIQFLPMDTYQCDETITSLDWSSDGTYCVAGLSSSRIIFFRLVVTNSNESLELEFQGSSYCPEHCEDNKLYAIIGPNDNYLYTCSRKSEFILVWHLRDTTWRVVHKVKCGMGVIGLSKGEVNNMDGNVQILLTALYGNDQCKFRECSQNSALIPILKYKEWKHLGHQSIKVKQGVKADSRATTLDISMSYILTAGVNDGRSVSTLVVSRLAIDKDSTLQVAESCAINTFPGQAKKINCINYNQYNEEYLLSFATGGDNGFVHFWSISSSPHTSGLKLRKDEEYYYMGSDGKGKTHKTHDKHLPEGMGHDNFSGATSGSGTPKPFHNIHKSIKVNIEVIGDVPLQADDDDDDDDDGKDVDTPSKGVTSNEGEAHPSTAEQGEVQPSMTEQFKAVKAAQAQKVAELQRDCSELKDDLCKRVDKFVEEMKNRIQTDPFEDLCEKACSKVDELTAAARNSP